MKKNGKSEKNGELHICDLFKHYGHRIVFSFMCTYSIIVIACFIIWREEEKSLKNAKVKTDVREYVLANIPSHGSFATLVHCLKAKFRFVTISFINYSDYIHMELSRLALFDLVCCVLDKSK